VRQSCVEEGILKLQSPYIEERNFGVCGVFSGKWYDRGGQDVSECDFAFQPWFACIDGAYGKVEEKTRNTSSGASVSRSGPHNKSYLTYVPYTSTLR
jgi:hypothetical protein